MSAWVREALWARLRDAGYVADEIPARGEANAPWYVRLMLGIAGWIGASFLLGFVGAAFALLIKNAGAEFVVGAGACAVAVLIFRAAPKNDFVAQFGLAISLSGQVLMAHADSQWFGQSATTIAVFLAFQQALLFVLVPNFVHRLWASWSAALAATFAMLASGLGPFAPAVTSAAFLWVALSEFRLARHGALVGPAVVGLALAVIQLSLIPGDLLGGLIDRQGQLFVLGTTGFWLGRAASVAVLLWAAVMLVRREGVGGASSQGRIALAGALILGLVSLKAPGVGPAVAILVVGFANADRVLAGLGIFALLGYLSHYYYSLQATLLEKSGLLVAAGIALIIVRFAMQCWWPKDREAGHA